MSREDIDIIVVRASESQREEVLDILREARQWLIEKGITGQWSAEIPNSVLAERISLGQVYIARPAGSNKAVATFSLLDHDEEVWGDQPPVAVYVHSLAVRRAWAGRGLGSRVLDEVGKIAHQSGRSRVRLDCWVDNASLRAYYERLHFQPCGTKVGEDGFAVQRYERPA